MPEVNTVILVGLAGGDAELTTIGESPVAKFGLATHKLIRHRTGERDERTDWHDIEIWGRLAEGAAKHIKKGKSVAVRGELRTWTSEHAGRKFRRTKIAADWFETTPERAEPAAVKKQAEGAEGE